MAIGKSALLELLNSRKCWDCGKDENGEPKKCPEYRHPQLKEKELENAAALVARADDSDPFAMQRALHYGRMGYVLLSDMVKQSRSFITQRAREPNGGLSGLEPLKRQVDQDRAWNQHRTAEYINEKAKRQVDQDKSEKAKRHSEDG